MSVCPLCDRDPEVATSFMGVEKIIGHACHCARDARQIRVAIGICCGHRVGKELLAEEDFHDGAPWSKPEDCTCHKGDPR